MVNCNRFFILSVVVLLTGLFARSIDAHPEDEFCVPGETSLDPALCDALSTLDSAKATADDVKPILDATGNARGFWSTAALYVTIGVRHILPAGLDHILFVLALFLSSTRLRALFLQISAFTVAHTATLGLAAAGVIAPAGSVVEPLIAATIACVAIENLYLKDLPRWRIYVVFLFGLVHGLGFAGFFGELGLPTGQFWSALIGFNVGVEIGQLSVVATAFVVGWLLRRWLAACGRADAYRRWVVVPLSILIGITGLVWTVQRVLSGLA
jgi:hypothetical protein